MDKADAVRVKVAVQGGLMHQVADGVMGNQQSIEFLQHADRFQAAQGTSGQTLMGVDFIDDEFDFPAFVIGAGERVCRIAAGIEQGGEEAMGFAIPGQRRVLDGVLDDANQAANAGFAPGTAGDRYSSLCGASISIEANASSATCTITATPNTVRGRTDTNRPAMGAVINPPTMSPPMAGA